MTLSEFRQKRKKAGVCTCCGREDAFTMAGRSYCDRCAARARESKAMAYKDDEKRDKMLACKKGIWERRKSAGLCPRCGQPANSGYVLCNSCRAKHRNYMNSYNNHPPRGEYGICWWCNKKAVVPGKQLCPECYEKALKTCRMMTERKKDRKAQGQERL